MKPALTYYALLVLLLASCFSCKTDSEKKKFVIGVSQCTLEGSWRKSMLLDMKVQASEYPGVSLLVEDAADSSLLQVEQIRSLIKRKVDLLLSPLMNRNLSLLLRSRPTVPAFRLSW